MTTITRSVTRAMRHDFKHYRRPIVVTLSPGHGDDVEDYISVRLKGCRKTFTATAGAVYCYIVLGHVEALRRLKRAAKKKGRAS